MTSPIDYLVLGHVTADLLADGTTQPGGTALYAAHTAARLGVRVGLVTACAPDWNAPTLPSTVAMACISTPSTTTFRNIYHGNQRNQYLTAQAAPLAWDNVPVAWRDAPVVHLGPVVHEVPPLAQHFPAALVGATPQGWLRYWDTTGHVGLVPERLTRINWTGIDMVVLSEEDIDGDEALVQSVAAAGPTVVLTRAERGATAWDHGQRYDVPAAPAVVVDPTGAGDVFATALLVALWYKEPLPQALRWATVAAAAVIEGPGTSSLLTLAELTTRLAELIS